MPKQRGETHVASKVPLNRERRESTDARHRTGNGLADVTVCAQQAESRGEEHGASARRSVLTCCKKNAKPRVATDGAMSWKPDRGEGEVRAVLLRAHMAAL